MNTEDACACLAMPAGGDPRGEPYELIRSDRRTLAIQIRDGRVIVRAPRRLSRREIDRFVASREAWIRAHLEASRRRMDAEVQPFAPEELRRLAEAARVDIPRRVQRFAPLVGVSVGRITIRCQRTRWGSCSARGNLNFNCLLMLCPEAVRDYVVVHELCHRRELNHSPRFWSEVARVMPDHAGHRRWLREHGSELIRRLNASTSEEEES